MPRRESMGRTRRSVLATLLAVAMLPLEACGPSVGDPFDDGAIVARVTTALLNDLEVGRRGIEVTSSRGFVRLSGRVKSEAEAAKAVLIARSVQGVLDVTSLLQVVP